MYRRLTSERLTRPPRMIRLRILRPTACAVGAALLAGRAAAQPAAPAAARADAAPAIEHVALAPGRVQPMAFAAPVTRVAVADTSIADAMVVSDRDVVFSGRRLGETDVLVWTGGQRRQYRLAVNSPADRPQVVLAVKIAEVRRDLLRSIGVSFRSQRPTSQNLVRGGTGTFNTDNAVNPTTGQVILPTASGFATLFTDLGTRDLLAVLDAEEQRGNARTLAEPTLMAGNRDSASFLAGGEFPIPAAVTAGPNGQPFITIVFREFGVRLSFTPEVLGDTIVKLAVRPEVSSLDNANGVVLSGIRVPALRTRRLSSTVDVPRDQSLVISGLLSDERERVRTGVPGLASLPVIGALFSSTRWQRSETELLVVVTPTVVTPGRARPQDVLPLLPDPRLPAREALEPRLPGSQGARPAPVPRPTTPAPDQP
jgi:pilus assembly protein CpaC